MNRLLRILLAGCIITLILLPSMKLLIQYKKYSVKKYYEKVKDNPKIFIYNYNEKGGLDQAYYITDLSDKKALISYYDSSELYNKGISEGLRKPKITIDPVSGDTGYLYPFSPPDVYKPIIAYKINYPIILLGYIDKDSLIAEVAEFNTDCWGYIQGYVYKKVIHKTIPPDSLVKQYEKFYDDPKFSETNSNYSRTSPYGIQCQ